MLILRFRSKNLDLLPNEITPDDFSIFQQLFGLCPSLNCMNFSCDREGDIFKRLVRESNGDNDDWVLKQFESVDWVEIRAVGLEVWQDDG